jgi:hypothetical protein
MPVLLDWNNQLTSMPYLQQIAQRNSLTGNTTSLLRPQSLHPFAGGENTAAGFSEDITMNTPAAPHEPVVMLQPVQHTVFNQVLAATTRPEQPDDKKQTVYIRSQLERTSVLPISKAQQQAITIPDVSGKKTTRDTNEVTPVINDAGQLQPLQPAVPPSLSPVTIHKEAMPGQAIKKEMVQAAVTEQYWPVAKQLMPVAGLEPLPQKITTPNKLVIGKITVEIVQPVQPTAKTKERIITRVVNTTAGNSSSAGRNKLSFGLGQL